MLPRKSHYGEEDYLSFTFADDCEEDESFSGGLGVGHTQTLPPRSSRSTRDHRFHRPRKKRKQHRKQRQRARQQLVDDVELELAVDPDDLPPRARWTIVATACLLLAMSLLLVGVTLRMAPIIDEMGRCCVFIPFSNYLYCERHISLRGERLVKLSTFFSTYSF